MAHPRYRTDPEIERMVIERYRSMTEAERFQEMVEMNEFVRQTQLAEIRRQHPDADEFEVKMRLASRWVRNLDLLKEAFGWDVAEKGY